jgi:putative transposase
MFGSGTTGRAAGLPELLSIDFFTVPTIRFQALYVFLVLAHDRRRIVHFNVTAHPTAEWTGQQLREAFPFEQVPRYLLRDRDRIFDREFRKDVEAMGIKEVLSAPRSPWQRAYVERVIGTIRCECLDHMIILNEASLYRHMKYFLAYYIQRGKDPGHFEITPRNPGTMTFDRFNQLLQQITTKLLGPG